MNGFGFIYIARQSQSGFGFVTGMQDSHRINIKM